MRSLSNVATVSPVWHLVTAEKSQPFWFWALVSTLATLEIRPWRKTYMLPCSSGKKKHKRSMLAKKKNGSVSWLQLSAEGLRHTRLNSHESLETTRDAVVWQWPLPCCLALSRHPVYQISVRAMWTLLTAPNTRGNKSRHRKSDLMSPCRWWATAILLPSAVMLIRLRLPRPERLRRR